jgi:hypothetical protein
LQLFDNLIIFYFQIFFLDSHVFENFIG